MKEGNILFCFEATMIHRLNNELRDNNIFMKRDDLIPFSFGGNKVRIANEYFDDMKKKGYDCIISYGSEKSNLNRVISNISESKNIPCYIISPIDKENNKTSYNSVLVNNTSSIIVNCSRNQVAQTVVEVKNRAINLGLNPYYINGNEFGKGNKSTSVLAYLKAFNEIRNYEIENDTMFDYIFHASGTGMTQAGLICGDAISETNKKIIGISIARSKSVGISAIEESVNSYLSSINYVGKQPKIEFEDNYINSGYGKFNDEIIKTIHKIYTTEGIPLDGTYTGKAFWGMEQYINKKKIKNKNILFIHTGGTPLFFNDLSMLSKETME